MAKKVSLPEHLYLALSKLAAKRGRRIDSLVEEIAREWIRHTRALQRRIGKSVFHVAASPAMTPEEAGEQSLQLDRGQEVVTKGIICDQDCLDDEDPTVH